MSDQKQKSTQQGTTTATYGHVDTPDTPDILKARSNTARIDPSIGARLGEQQRQLNSSLASPTGGYVTPQIKDAIQRSQSRELMQEAGAQTRAGQFDVNRINTSKDLALADLTKKQFVQTGGTSTGSGTVTQSQSPLGTIAQVGAAAAPMSL